MLSCSADADVYSEVENSLRHSPPGTGSSVATVAELSANIGRRLQAHARVWREQRAVQLGALWQRTQAVSNHVREAWVNAGQALHQQAQANTQRE